MPGSFANGEPHARPQALVAAHYRLQAMQEGIDGKQQQADLYQATIDAIQRSYPFILDMVSKGEYPVKLPKRPEELMGDDYAAHEQPQQPEPLAMSVSQRGGGGRAPPPGDD
jgi:hypothetical protein